MGIMNNNISLSTEGKGINFRNFSTSEYVNDEGETRQVSTGDIKVGNLTLTVHFRSHDEMTNFCLSHNIGFDGKNTSKQVVRRCDKVDQLFKLLGICSDEAQKEFLAFMTKRNPELVAMATGDTPKNKGDFPLVYDILDEICYQLGFVGEE